MVTSTLEFDIEMETANVNGSSNGQKFKNIEENQLRPDCQVSLWTNNGSHGTSSFIEQVSDLILSPSKFRQLNDSVVDFKQPRELEVGLKNTRREREEKRETKFTKRDAAKIHTLLVFPEKKTIRKYWSFLLANTL